MSTRRAEPNQPLNQERYMSSPEYAELRGLSGNAVAAKAELVWYPRKRSLLFFLQALSLQPGGLRRVAEELVQMFPERIGTLEMHQHGIKPGGVYSLKDARHIVENWPDGFSCENRYGNFDVSALVDYEDDFPSRLARVNRVTPEYETSVDKLLARCRSDLSSLPSLLIELAINPQFQIRLPGEKDTGFLLERNRAYSQGIDPDEISFRTVGHPCFRDLTGALFEYQQRLTNNAGPLFAETSISRSVFDTLDAGLATRKMVVIEGDARLGKTVAAEEWCTRHLGDARLVKLSGITNKTTFFRALARVLGLASTYTRKSMEMQARVEDMLQRSKLMVVIDEAHHLFSPAERVYTRPELVDWINTALFNHGVPVALICTPQFLHRMTKVERQTGWNAAQFRGRVMRWTSLPDAPTKADLKSVTRKLLPDCPKECIEIVVGYAMASQRHFPAIVDLIDEARLIASQEGRESVAYSDLERALNEYRLPTDAALARISGDREPVLKARGRHLETEIQDGFQSPGNRPRPANDLDAEIGSAPPSRVLTHGASQTRQHGALVDS